MTLSFTSPMKLHLNRCVIVRKGPQYVTFYPYVRNSSPPSRLSNTTKSQHASETLANVDAVLFLPTTCCLRQDPCGETVCLAVGLGSTTNRIIVSLEFPSVRVHTFFLGEWDRKSVSGSRPSDGCTGGPEGSRGNPRLRGCETHLWRAIRRYARAFSVRHQTF